MHATLFYNQKCNLKGIKTGVISTQCKESKEKQGKGKLLNINIKPIQQISTSKEGLSIFTQSFFHHQAIKHTTCNT